MPDAATTLQEQLDEARDQLRHLRDAGLLDMEADEVKRLRNLLRADMEREIVWGYVYQRSKYAGWIIFGGAAILAAFRNDAATLVDWVRVYVLGRQP